MVQFLGSSEQGLIGKIDVLKQICGFLLVFASKVRNFNFTLLLNDINFSHLLVLGDEANYVVCQTSICLPRCRTYFMLIAFSFFELLAIAWKHLYLYILLYKTIIVGLKKMLLEYQSSGQNLIFTLNIFFIELSCKYSFA